MRKPEESQTVPGGNIGSRVRVPLRTNEQGIDVAIDPVEDIYSGMLKRQARQEGYFTDVKEASDL